MTRKITEADRRATAKYHREKCFAVTVRFNKAEDADIIEWLNSQPVKVDALRQAIRSQMLGEQEPRTALRRLF